MQEISNRYQDTTIALNVASLPRKIRAITDGGAAWENHGYRSKFAARKAVVYYMAVNGWTWPQAHDYILSDPTRPVWDLWASGKSEIGYSGRLRRLHRDWAQVTAWATCNGPRTPADIRMICGELRGHAEALEWKGTPGRTDRAVYVAMITLAEQSKSLTVILAEREAMLAAGVAERKTARKSLNRLTAANLIERAGYAGKTGRYTLTETVLHKYPILILKNYTDSEYGVSVQQTRATLTPTDFGVGIGKAALDIYLALSDTPLIAARIAEQANVSPCTVSRHVKMLEQQGLAVKTPKGWTRGLGDIADYEPPRERVKERTARVERERAKYYAKREPAPEVCRECGQPARDRLTGIGIVCDQCRSDILAIGRAALCILLHPSTREHAKRASSLSPLAT